MSVETEGGLNNRQTLFRLAFALVLLGGAFALRWPGGLLPDFQVWTAAKALADAGANPYDAELLNQELQSSPNYGRWWQDEPARFRVFFFNPPTWLAVLWIFRFSALLMSGFGVVTLAGSIVALSREADDRTFGGYILVTAIVMLSPLASSTFSFGQTGLLLAGLLGWRIVAAGTGLGAVPLALLAFKPHIALAAFLPEFVSVPSSAFRRLVPPAALVVVFTVVLYGSSPFGWWVDATISGSEWLPIDDMTLATLSPRWILPSALNLPLLAIGFGVIAWVGKRATAANPATLILFSVGLSVFLSGHGFRHDWLWIVLIPVVQRWDLTRSVFGVAGVLIGLSITTATVEFPRPVISSQSVVALIIVAYLGLELVRQTREPSPVGAEAESLGV